MKVKFSRSGCCGWSSFHHGKIVSLACSSCHPLFASAVLGLFTKLGLRRDATCCMPFLLLEARCAATVAAIALAPTPGSKQPEPKAIMDCSEVLATFTPSGVPMYCGIVRLRVRNTRHGSRRDGMRVRRNCVRWRRETYCNRGCPGASLHLIGVLDVVLFNALLVVSLVVCQSSHRRA